MTDGVLKGVRVADFSRVLAGPYATMMLADFGADVIKIESPAGDDTREWVPPVDATGQSTYFGSVNRNKRSVMLDLKNPDDLAFARELALSADVVVENFRTGVMKRFGLDYESVSAENPGVVYASITGFGSGAGADLAGYDLLVQAVGGLMSITGQSHQEPSKVGVALVDVLTGINAVNGILLGLRDRDHNGSGQGQHIEVNLLGTLLSSLTNQASAALATGHSPTRIGNAHPSIAPYEIFAAQDRHIVIAAGNDKLFHELVEVLGEPELATDERFLSNADRVIHRDELKTLLEGALQKKSAVQWAELLSHKGIPAGLVNNINEAFKLATELGLEPVVEIAVDAGVVARAGAQDDTGAGAQDDTVAAQSAGKVSKQVANPIHMSRTPVSYNSAPPALGSAGRATWLDNAKSKR